MPVLARTYLQLPLRQWGAGNVYQLKGKHCQKPHCSNGAVDMFGPAYHKFIVYLKLYMVASILQLQILEYKERLKACMYLSQLPSLDYIW